MREALLNVKDVSGLLHVHAKTIYGWTKTGKLPYVPVNGRVRFEERQLQEFLERRRTRWYDLEALSTRPALPLDVYDRLHLKGGYGAVGKSTRRWNYGFGTVYLRKTEGGTDHWYIEYRSRQGVRIRQAVREAHSREEALLVLHSKTTALLSGRPAPQRTAELTPFGDFADKYLTEYARSEKVSWKTDEYKLHPIRKYFGALPMNAITELKIREFREARLAAGVTKTTTNRYLALLKKMFNWAISRGFLASNPVKGIKMFSETDMARDRVLRPDEEDRLFAELKPRIRPFILTLLNTGLRYREALNLTWDCVDFTRRRIKVERTKSKRARIIPINSILFEVMTELRSGSKGPRVFPFKSLRTGFESACERAGLADFTFHDLRRTFGTRLLERGVDIVTIQKLYGHSSVLVTQRYLHPSDELSIEAVELLAGDLSQTCHKTGKSAFPVSTNPALRAS